jgi:uncharacterized metal-binding protein YceD (DUF177 family)
MGLTVNLRHLEAHNLRLEGELAVEELDIDTRDEVIRLHRPLRYALEVQKMDHSLLIQGRLGMTLSCQCVRCLKPFEHELELRQWTIDVPLQGDEAVPVVNDCVDLTPLLREDILLEFPQHPLCNPECRGLPDPSVGKAKNKTGGTGKSENEAGSSAWAELNKLKF